MDSEKRIDKTLYGKTRKEVCDKLAMVFVQRHAIRIAKHIIEQGIKEDVQYEYLFGFHDGFSMALDLILYGSMNLQEIMTEIPNPEQAREKGGPG